MAAHSKNLIVVHDSRILSFKCCSVIGFLVLNLVGFAGNALANPTGPAVVAGSATVQSGTGTVAVHQTSPTTIINWSTFSINRGETTQFFQPNSQSAALNRVLGGSTSNINGSLLANGQVYLINQNGIVIGPGGDVNVAGGFAASTRDISNSDFLNGNLHFMGSGTGEVLNLGQVNSSLGNVIFVGKVVKNEGTIKTKATAGLVASDDVLLGQQNADGSTITVNPSPTASSATHETAVSNAGTIHAAAAELKAANGNIYAVAINNGGVIRAKVVKSEGGHIWLTSDSGSVVNSGTLNASGKGHGSTGGSVYLSSTAGKVTDSGSITAKGGKDGVGGSVDLFAASLSFTGTVDVTAKDGVLGQLLLDPTSLTVQTGGTGTITGGMNDNTSSTIDPGTVENALATANVTLNADESLTIANAINWTSSSTLTLSTNTSGSSSLTIDAAIQGANGGLTIAMAGNDQIVTNASGSVNVNTFTLQSGFWNQVVGLPGNLHVLPSFAANNFVLEGSSLFLRASGGSGTQSSPYQIVDIYGLQGIGSPSNNLLSQDFVLNNSIQAGNTSTWNGGAGFVPIGNTSDPFNGSFNGGDYTLSNLQIVSAGGAGLFGVAGAGSSVSDLSIAGGKIQGNSVYVGALEGQNLGGTVTMCDETADVITSSGNGGLVGPPGYDPSVHSSAYNNAFLAKYDAKYGLKQSANEQAAEKAAAAAYETSQIDTLKANMIAANHYAKADKDFLAKKAADQKARHDAALHTALVNYKFSSPGFVFEYDFKFLHAYLREKKHKEAFLRADDRAFIRAYYDKHGEAEANAEEAAYYVDKDRAKNHLIDYNFLYELGHRRDHKKKFIFDDGYAFEKSHKKADDKAQAKAWIIAYYAAKDQAHENAYEEAYAYAFNYAFDTAKRDKAEMNR